VAIALLFVSFVVFFFISLSRVLQKTSVARFLFDRLPGGQHFRRVYDVLHSYRNSPRALMSGFWLSVLNNAITVFFVYVLGKAMGYSELPFAIY
jgi:hypothetical protein